METQPFSSLPSHRHCPVCGQAIAPEARFCSTQCQETMAARDRSQRRTTWILFGLLALLVVVWLLYSFWGGG